MTKSTITRMPARVRLVEQPAEVLDRAELGQHADEVG